MFGMLFQRRSEEELAEIQGSPSSFSQLRTEILILLTDLCVLMV